MKHSKLLIAAALSAAGWCSASQAQTVIYDVTPYYGSSTGTTQSESNWTVYPGQPPTIGYAVGEYRDYNGNWRERTEPFAVIGTPRTYVYPEASTLVYPSSGVIYTIPYGVDMYFDNSPGMPRY